MTIVRQREWQTDRQTERCMSTTPREAETPPFSPPPRTFTPWHAAAAGVTLSWRSLAQPSRQLWTVDEISSSKALSQKSDARVCEQNISDLLWSTRRPISVRSWTTCATVSGSHNKTISTAVFVGGHCRRNASLPNTRNRNPQDSEFEHLYSPRMVGEIKKEKKTIGTSNKQTVIWPNYLNYLNYSV